MSEETKHFPPNAKIYYNHETMNEETAISIEAATPKEAWEMFMKLRKEISK